MNLVRRIFGSSVGKKFVMAVTGCLLVLFIIGHLVGNLQIFLGRDQLNAYGRLLHSSGELIWVVRLGLLVLAGLHITTAIQLALENRAARGMPYDQPKFAAATYASRTMVMSGLIVAAFVIYHLLHFTAQVPAVNLVGINFGDLEDGQGRHDVFGMVVRGFSNGWVSLFYLLGVGLLCLHLSHGVSSMFQSMGWRREPYRRLLDRLAVVLGWLVFLGYASIPLAVLMGYGKD